jgi:hypothetical protein
MAEHTAEFSLSYIDELLSPARTAKNAPIVSENPVK